MRPEEAKGKRVGLVVTADEPALFFSSAGIAEGYLEAADVRSGVYAEAYGLRGEPFDVVADRFDEVIIAQRMDSAPCPERLQEIVVAFLKACGVPFSDDAPLENLLALCAPYVDDGL